MDVLGRLASLGMTVLAVIHQPRVEIYRKFDDLLMIAPGGKTAFMGKASAAKPYFENLGFEFASGSNEADVLMDILSGVGVNHKNDYKIPDLISLWSDVEDSNSSKDSAELQSSDIHSQNTSTIHSEIISAPSASTADDDEFHELCEGLASDRGANLFYQFYLTHNLSLLQQYRTLPGLILEVAVGTIAGALMGVAVNGVDEIYLGIMKEPYTLLSSAPIFWLIVQFIMLVGSAVALAAAPAGVKVFAEELPVYWRYTGSGHSTIAYYLVN
jgi:hypothetical protein